MVQDWLIDEEVRELPESIDEVNAKLLNHYIEHKLFVVVYIYSSKTSVTIFSERPPLPPDCSVLFHLYQHTSYLIFHFLSLKTTFIPYLFIALSSFV